MLDARTDLAPLVRGFLEADGFRILDGRDDLVVAGRPGTAGDHDLRLVWTLPAGEAPRRCESRLRASFSAHRPSYPDAKAYLVAPSRGGFTREFRQRLQDENLKLLTPVQFFDTPFHRELMPSATRSAIEEVRAEGRRLSPARVAQRYKQENASGEVGEGGDLLETLLSDLQSMGSARLRVVVGRAGSGKSVLFNSLFHSLYEGFLDAKRRQALRPRPVPFVPHHLRDAGFPRLPLVIDSVLRSEVAVPVQQKAFRWLLAQGLGAWLLDGLDELYSGDPQFFDELADFVTTSGSCAQVTLFCRDSLLSTSDAFEEFRELCGESDLLTVYRLTEWDVAAKRAFAYLELEGRPESEGESSAAVTHFLQDLGSAPALGTLSGLPFYCKLLLDEFREGHLQAHDDEVALLELVVDGMIRREVDKGLLDLGLFDRNGLHDWLEAIAVSYVEDGRYSEVDRAEALEYGRMVIRERVDPEQQEQLLLSLVQFPLFRDAAGRARFAFSHDMIAEALAARGFLRVLARDAATAGRRLARFELEGSTLLRLMSRRFGDEHREPLENALRGGSVRGGAFSRLLTLLMLARPERDLLRRAGVDLEGRDLAGVRFDGRDLSGMSFRGADLSRAAFERCDLRDALLEGAFLRFTRFGADNRLEGARFGDAERAESVHDGRRLCETPERIQRWVARVTGRGDEAWEPCPTALQLRHLFGKYITPLGEPRRDDLRRAALAAGKRYSQAASTEQCIDEASRHGYLVGPDRRVRYRRAAGDLYSEMVSLVRDSRISDGLGRLIADLCLRRGCAHRLLRAA